MVRAPALTELFDSVAIRIVGPKAWDEHLSIAWHITDPDEHYRMELSNGALIHHPVAEPATGDVTVTLARPQLLGLLMAGDADGVAIEGDANVLAKLIALTDNPDPDITIVTL